MSQLQNLIDPPISNHAASRINGFCGAGRLVLGQDHCLQAHEMHQPLYTFLVGPSGLPHSSRRTSCDSRRRDGRYRRSIQRIRNRLSSLSPWAGSRNRARQTQQCTLLPIESQGLIAAPLAPQSLKRRPHFSLRKSTSTLSLTISPGRVDR